MMDDKRCLYFIAFWHYSAWAHVCVFDIVNFLVLFYVYCMVDDRHCCTDNKRCSVPLLLHQMAVGRCVSGASPSPSVTACGRANSQASFLCPKLKTPLAQ